MPIAKVALLFVHRACLNEAVGLHVRGRLYQVTSEILDATTTKCRWPKWRFTLYIGVLSKILPLTKIGTCLLTASFPKLFQKFFIVNGADVNATAPGDDWIGAR